MLTITLRSRAEMTPQYVTLPGCHPPKCKIGIKENYEKIVDHKGAKPYWVTDFRGHSTQVFDKAMARTHRWHEFDDADDAQQFIIRTTQDEWRSFRCRGNKKLTAFVLEGHLASLPEFVRFIEMQTKDTKIDWTQFGLTEMCVDELGLSLDENYVATISKPVNERQFLKHLEEADENCSLITLFHGTSKRALIEIIKESLRPSRDGALGRGVYLGERKKAFQFSTMSRFSMRTRGSRGTRRATNRLANSLENISRFVVLECEVLLKDLEVVSYVPRSMNENPYIMSRNRPSFLSRLDRSSTDVSLDYCKSQLDKDILFTGFQQPEFVIRDESRIIIRKIHFTI